MAAGPRALAEAKKVRTRLIGQVDEQRNPRTRATVNQLMDKYLDVVDVEVTTRARYEGSDTPSRAPVAGRAAGSPGSPARRSTRSMRSCVVVESIATAVRSSFTLICGLAAV